MCRRTACAPVASDAAKLLSAAILSSCCRTAAADGTVVAKIMQLHRSRGVARLAVTVTHGADVAYGERSAANVHLRRFR